MLNKFFHRLEWGYNPGLPERFRAAWGCRAVYTGTEQIDLDPKQTDCIEEDADVGHLLELLRTTRWREAINDRVPRLRPNVAEEFTAWNDNGFVVKVNTNGSHGHLYLVAFLDATWWPDLGDAPTVDALRKAPFHRWRDAVFAMAPEVRADRLAGLGRDEVEALLEPAILGDDKVARDQIIARYTEIDPRAGAAARKAAHQRWGSAPHRSDTPTQ